MDAGWLLPVLVLWPLPAAFVCYGIGRRSKTARDVLAVVACAAELLLALGLAVLVARGARPAFAWPGFAGLGLGLEADGFRALYAVLTSLLWLATGVFSRAYFGGYHNRNRYWFFCLLTLSAAMGVFLSADLATTFIFFEVMSLTSYAMVAHDESPAALRAAATYLAVAVVGGLAMLMGLFLLYAHVGTLAIGALPAALAGMPRGRLYLAATLLLVGFGAKAGLFPLHIWLPKAHPAAPAPASALLSGILTKTGVFGVVVIAVRLMPGNLAWAVVLLLVGVATMLAGAVLALFSIDLKRTLACSSVSQIGFITIGIATAQLLGAHNGLAVWGTVLHMLNHSLLKLVLFCAAGVVYMNLHRLDLNGIRGWGRGKPVLALSFLVGALGLGGVPLWNGYVSKTLLHESLVECARLFEGTALGGLLRVTEVLFLLAGGLTVAYMLKLFVAVFVEKPAVPHGKAGGRYMGRATGVMLLCGAALATLLGLFPHRIAERLAIFSQPFMDGHAPQHAVHYAGWVNLRGAAISLAAGALVYLLVVRGLLMRRAPDGRRVYVDRWPPRLDLENAVYRPLIAGLAAFLVAVLGFAGGLPQRLFALLLRAGTVVAATACRLPQRLFSGLLHAGTALLAAVGGLPGRVAGFITTSLLRPRRPLRGPTRFYSRYYALLFPGQAHAGAADGARHESFTRNLLMFGVGLCAVLLFAVGVWLVTGR